MRVIRTIVVALLFIAAVFLASANVQEVEIVFLPDLPLAGWPSVQSVELPLFVIVLGSLVVGVLVGGFGALLEQARLRRAVRRATKEKEKLAGELREVRAELERAESARAELERELERTRSAGSSVQQAAAVETAPASPEGEPAGGS